jgi:hypothetical protein
MGDRLVAPRRYHGAGTRERKQQLVMLKYCFLSSINADRSA